MSHYAWSQGKEEPPQATPFKKHFYALEKRIEKIETQMATLLHLIEINRIMIKKLLDEKRKK